MPFYATYYLNGHDIIAPMLTAEEVPFRMKENAFVKQYEKDNTFLRPIAGSLFDRPPKSSLTPNSKLQAQYRKTTRSFNDLSDAIIRA